MNRILASTLETNRSVSQHLLLLAHQFLFAHLILSSITFSEQAADVTLLRTQSVSKKYVKKRDRIVTRGLRVDERCNALLPLTVRLAVESEQVGKCRRGVWMVCSFVYDKKGRRKVGSGG